MYTYIHTYITTNMLIPLFMRRASIEIFNNSEHPIAIKFRYPHFIVWIGIYTWCPLKFIQEIVVSEIHVNIRHLVFCFIF